MDVVMSVKIPRENNAKTSIASFSMRSMTVCMLVDEVIIFVFAWPKHPRQEIAQFFAAILAMVFVVRSAYSKIQALVMVENGINPRPCAFGRLTESTESHERPLGL